MQNENRLVPDFWAETVEEITETYTPEGGTEQTATYKIGTAHPIIGGILDKLTWVRTHAAAVWWNKLAGVTLKEKITSMDGEIAQLNGKIPSFKVNYGSGFAGDCNTTINPGIYNETLSYNAVNGPGFYAYLMVFGDTVNFTQVAFGYNTDKIAIRHRYNGSWSTWRTI